MQTLIKKILEIYPRREELNIPYGQDKALAIHGKHEIRDLFEELKTSINRLSSITKNITETILPFLTSVMASPESGNKTQNPKIHLA